LLSIGGATYTEGGFADSTSAINAANNIWAMFGPETAGSSVNRPFGSAEVDGFDFDFESGVSNVAPFANQLRSLMDADTAASGKQWFLTAAPQCPYPDSADNAMLSGAVYFDAIWVQFYNNYCGLQSFVSGATTQNNFNFLTWDNWAKTVSQNPAVKVLLGVPGSPSAAGSGYESGSTLTSIISYCKQFSSFGGVMTWDMSQIYANEGFLDGVYSDLGAAGTVYVPTSPAVSPVIALQTSTFITVTTSAAATTFPQSSGTVPQWGQCGGNGYTGPTACVAPYTCVENSVWWSQCE
jgi:chitinase